MRHFDGIVRHVYFDHCPIGLVYTCAKDVLGFVKLQPAILNILLDSEFGIAIVFYGLLVQQFDHSTAQVATQCAIGPSRGFVYCVLNLLFGAYLV